MSNKVQISSKYKLLYTTTDSLIIKYGGRGSGKSFVASDWACRWTFTPGERILYLRYTLTSAETSIIPEYEETINNINATKYFKKSKRFIKNIGTGSDIFFLGIKTSSGNQTANLKSIKNPTKAIIDEAEELPDYDTFQKLKRSIRKKGAINQIVLVLNPCAKTHWIYKKYFEENSIPDYFTGSKNGITYIHSNYFDNYDNLSEEFLNDAKETKERNDLEYRQIFLGEWLDYTKDYPFSSEKLNRFTLEDLLNYNESDLDTIVSYTDIAYGGGDYFCSVFAKVFDGKVYIFDVIFTKRDISYSQPLLIEKLRKHKVKHYGIEKNAGGSAVAFAVEDEMYKTDKESVMYPVTAKGNKIVRIISEQNDILKNFYFRKDFTDNSDYHLFMNNITTFNTDDKNVNDDAPDTCAGLNKLLRTHLYY